MTSYANPSAASRSQSLQAAPTRITVFSFYPDMPKPITDMTKASSSSSSSSSPSSDSSEDEGEHMTLAQLTRKKGVAVDEDVISATSVLSGENDEEENDEEMKFYDEDGAHQGFDGPVNGYTLEDNCCVLVKLDDDSHDQLMKKFGYKYCILLCFLECLTATGHI